MTVKIFVKTKDDGVVQGPVSSEQIKKLAIQGKLKPHHLLSKDGRTWQRASKVKGIGFPPEQEAGEEGGSSSTEQDSPGTASKTAVTAPEPTEAAVDAGIVDSVAVVSSDGEMTEATPRELSAEDKTKLKQLEAALSSRVPLLGPSVRRRAVRGLAELPTTEAVEVLAKAVATSKHADVRESASQALKLLSKQEQIDAICHYWCSTQNRSVALASLLRDRSWVASQPVTDRVLCALLVGQPEVIQDMGPSAVSAILALTDDDDSEIAQSATVTLRTLRDRPSLDALYDLAVSEDNPTAREILIEQDYAPADEDQRSTWFFFTGQYDKYDVSDPNRDRMKAEYGSADEGHRQRIVEALCEVGRKDWVDILVGGSLWDRLPNLPDGDWRAASRVLRSCAAFDDMWRMVQMSSPPIGAEIMAVLAQEEWEPEAQEERQIYDELRQLASGLTGHLTSSLWETLPFRDISLGSSEPVTQAFFTPDGDKLISSSWDGEHWRGNICLWAMPGGECLWSSNNDPRGASYFKVDLGNDLLVTADAKKAFLRRMSTGECFKTITEHDDNLTGIAIAPQHQLLATATLAGTIGLWSLPDGSPVKTIEAHEETAWDLAISRDGQLMASVGTGADYKGTLRLWSLPDGELVRELQDAPNERVVFSPDQRQVVCVKDKVCIWNVSDGQLVCTMKSPIGSLRIGDAVVSPDGRFFAAAGSAGQVCLFSLSDGSLVQTLRQHECDVNRVRFSCDSRLLASGDVSGNLRWFTAPDWTPLNMPSMIWSNVSDLAMNPEGTILVEYGSAGIRKTGSGHDIDSQGVLRVCQNEFGHLSQMRADSAASELIDRVYAAASTRGPGSDAKRWLAFTHALFCCQYRIKLLLQGENEEFVREFATNESVPISVRKIAASMLSDETIVADLEERDQRLLTGSQDEEAGRRAVSEKARSERVKLAKAAAAKQKKIKRMVRGQFCRAEEVLAVLGEDCEALRNAMLAKREAIAIAAWSPADLRDLLPDGECGLCGKCHVFDWMVVYNISMPGRHEQKTSRKELDEFVQRFKDEIHRHDRRKVFGQKKLDSKVSPSDSTCQIIVTSHANTQWLLWCHECLDAAYRSVGGTPNRSAKKSMHAPDADHDKEDRPDSVSCEGKSPTKQPVEGNEQVVGHGTRGGDSTEKQDYDTSSLKEVVFSVSAGKVTPPTAELTAEQQEFLDRLTSVIQRASQLRSEFKKLAQQEFAAQGYEGLEQELFADPVDQILPNWHSLAILFDWKEKDDNYGLIIFRLFFEVVNPNDLNGVVALHFGDFSDSDTLCGIVIRAKEETAICHVAEQFDAKRMVSGLLPYPTRFLRTSADDGHLLARTFSLPACAELQNGRVRPNEEAGMASVLAEAAKGTKWVAVT
jgi:HEAT repeat protein